MNIKVNSYLSFKGNCQEALDYYSKIFNAKVLNKKTYESSNMDIPEHYRNKLQHAELKGNGIHFMAYDASPDTPINTGNNIHMSVDLDNKERTHEVFNSLSNGGQIHHNLQEKEWNALYGRCTDQFGINWMVNCNL